VNWGRHLHVDAEEALRAANTKFEQRFTCMEALAAQRGLQLMSLAAAEWDALWREAKLNRT
jgi:ATP diphosphatase